MTSPAIDYYLISSFVLLLFLPGILLLAFFSRRFKLSLAPPEIIMLGSVFWTAILVGPSVLLGLFSLGVLWYFVVFTIASVAIIIGSGSYFLVKKFKEGSLRIHTSRDPHSYVISAYVLLIWIFIFLLTIYSIILLDWDAIMIYLPMAKAIISTGNLTYNPYMLSETAMAYPPLLPMIYAWSMFFTNGLYLRFLPIIFFLLANLVIWQLTKIIGGKGPISVIAFSSMISVQMLVALNGLYLDLAFIFYTSTSIYLVSRVLSEKSHRMFWYLSTGLTCSLNAITSEQGVVMVFLVFSFLVLCLARNITGRLIFPLITALPFIVQLANLIRLSYPFSLLLAIFLVIFVLSIGLFYLSTRLAHIVVPSSRNGSIKGMILFSIACIPAVIFYVRNIFLLGVFTARLPISQTSSLYSLGFGSTSESPNPTDYFSWYNLFLAAGSVAPYIIPVIVGFLLLFRHKSEKTDPTSLGGIVSLLILIWFIALLMMWSITFRCSYTVTEFRRLTYFAPIFSIIISLGASALYERSKLGKHTLVLFVLSNTLILFYIWINRESLFVFFKYIIFDTNVFDLLVFSSVLVIPILILVIIRRLTVNLGNGNRYSRKLPAIFFLSTMVVSCYVPAYMVQLSSTEVTRQTWDPYYYNSAGAMWFWDEVIRFYNTYLNDDFITVGFWNSPIIVFANRAYVDPGNYWGFTFLIPFLLCNDTNRLLEMLYSQNIRYFLIPTPDCLNPTFYDEYTFLTQRYLLFKMITQDPHFIVYGYFRYFTLYKLMG